MSDTPDTINIATMLSAIAEHSDIELTRHVRRAAHPDGLWCLVRRSRIGAGTFTYTGKHLIAVIHAAWAGEPPGAVGDGARGRVATTNTTKDK